LEVNLAKDIPINPLQYIDPSASDEISPVRLTQVLLLLDVRGNSPPCGRRYQCLHVPENAMVSPVSSLTFRWQATSPDAPNLTEPPGRYSCPMDQEYLPGAAPC